MTARQLSDWLRALHPVTEPTVDQVVIGNPDVAVTGIAVAWIATWTALAEAVARGCNVFVTHEPTFYGHLDLAETEATLDAVAPRGALTLGPARAAKREWIEQHQLVVIRCHDVLDAMPGGVVDSLAAALGFAARDYLATTSHHRVISLPEPVLARDLAQRMATTLEGIGQPGVAFYGDPARPVRTLGLGTGYASHPWDLLALGAEMAVTIDDRIKTWMEPAWAADTGYPLVVIHHGASEEWGVRTLATWVAQQFPAVPVQLIPQGCTARWIPSRPGWR